ncbi:restriction endonuclease subunit S [Kordia jejudonensis]|uniref:restriction endonuclease subunit S n=1 Tax=Kordia jejudonensis TaxID=1348245 RepID=UPI00069AF72A|nr:restriction endonuclease subunit S [Kordia jejudonensis]
MQKDVNKVPKLRFKEFSEDWKIEPIGNYIDLLSGHAFKGDDISEDEAGTRILRGINITEGYIRHDVNIDRYYKGDISKFKKIILEVDDLVLGMDGSKVGKNVALITDKDKGSLLIQRVARIRANRLSDIRYIYQHIFSSKFHRYVDVVNTSSGIPHISSKQIKEFKIGFPSLKEQKKIASFLSSVDTKLNLLQQKKDHLTHYKKGVMQQIFSQQLRFKDVDGNEFPKWEEKRLKDVGEFKNGINKDKKDFGFGFPFINLMDVFGKPTISDLDLDLVNVNDKELELYELKKGDVLFIRSSVKQSGVGETSVVLRDLKNTVYSGFLIRFRDNKIKIDLNYKKYCFSSKSFRNNLISLSTTSANTNINQESLNKLKIQLPSLKEQTKIATFLSAIDNKIALVATQIENTQQFKKGLLQQMFV